MTTSALLSDVRVRGVRIELTPASDLALWFPGDPPADLLARIKAHKRPLVALLSGRSPEVCPGCSVRILSDPSPDLVGHAVLCGWRDCPYRSGPRPPA